LPSAPWPVSGASSAKALSAAAMAAPVSSADKDGYAADGAAIGRIGHGDGLARSGIDPLAVHPGPFFQQGALSLIDCRHICSVLFIV
jgi:hypothetical protein